MEAERRLSDAEVSLVLRRAAEESSETGLTVAQVQEIAADVGLAPDAIRRALADSASGALRPAASEHRFGVPVSVAKDVALPGALTDEGWDVLVSTLRATFGAVGKVSQSGVVREWRNGKLRIAVEPTVAGHRLRMSTQKEGAFRGALLGVAASAVWTAALVAGATARPAMGILAGAPALVGIMLACWPFLTLPKWARGRAAQFDAIAREASALAVVPRVAELPSGDAAGAGTE